MNGSGLGARAVVLVSLVLGTCGGRAADVYSPEQESVLLAALAELERANGEAASAREAGRLDDCLAIQEQALDQLLARLPAEHALGQVVGAARTRAAGAESAEARGGVLQSAVDQALIDLRFRPILEAPVPAGWPHLTPVGWIEVKSCPAYRAAWVERAELAEGARNSMFFMLFNHIQRNDIKMTAPVEMTYDAGDAAGRGSESAMAFLYQRPDQGRVGPEGAVEVRDIAPATVVSLGLRGVDSSAGIRAAEARLRAWLEKGKDQYSACGPVRVLGYNSPAVPAAVRYSEIQIPVLVSGDAGAEDWPCFRGPGRQGISREKGLPTEWSATSGVRWRTEIAGAGWSSPIVWGDRVFVTTALGDGASLHLICLDRATGHILWDKEVVQQKAGHKSPQNSYATATPATDGERVYVLACDGRILGVSADGEVEWTNSDFGEYYSEHGLGTSPVLYEDLVIVAFDWSSPGPDTKVGWQIPWDKAVILAVDKSTGRTRWRGSRGLSRIAHVVPQLATVDGRDELVSAAGDVVQGFDPKTGERLWTASSPGEGVVPSVVVGDGLAFTASGFGDSRVCAVRLGGRGTVTGTHTVWESRDDVPKMPSMLYVSPYLYLITEGGVARCLRGATGEVLWRQRLRGPFSASPVWADGKIYLLSEKGTTTIVEAGPQFTQVAENEIGEKCCASPAISSGNIFIRSERALYCVGP